MIQYIVTLSYQEVLQKNRSSSIIKSFTLLETTQEKLNLIINSLVVRLLGGDGLMEFIKHHIMAQQEH